MHLVLEIVLLLHTFRQLYISVKIIITYFHRLRSLRNVGEDETENFYSLGQNDFVWDIRKERIAYKFPFYTRQAQTFEQGWFNTFL